MIIGCLGDVVFSVSSEKIQTLDKFKRQGSASFATHARHLGKPCLEYTGSDADKISFSIRLSSYLGSDVMAEMNKIINYTRSGTALVLVLGDYAYGYRWVIKDYSESITSYDGRGNATIIDVSLNLLEYAR